ncbi:MAG: hypothetical protein ABEJ72_01685 [Candidatus Aenigmatarchaeota archaeon]
MIFLQFLKFSLGWFLLTSNISRFPFFLLLTFSITYSTIYLYYKNKIGVDMRTKRKLTVGFLSGVAIISYIISFFIYSFPLPLIVIFAVGVLTVLIHKNTWIDIQLPRIGGATISLFFIFVVFTFYSLTNPHIAESNEIIRERMEKYERKLPNDVVHRLRMIENKTERYQTLKEVERALEKERKEILKDLNGG